MKLPRSLFAALAVVFLLGVSGSLATAAETYKIDPVHSTVLFKINHLGVGNYIGRFNDVSGTYVLNAEDPTQASFNVTVKTDSVDTHEDKRDQHLKSPDFFNATQFPVITLKSKSVKKKGEQGYDVTAELSLHGVTKTIPLTIQHIGSGKDPWGNFRSGFEAELTIKRGDYGISFMPQALGEEVKIMVNVEGIRQ